MSHIKSIALKHVELGMYVTEKTDGVADGSMQEKGFIHRDETLTKLKNKGITELFIDVSKGKDSPYAVPVLSKSTQFKSRVKLSEERTKAEKVYGEARTLVGDLMNDVKMGKAIDVGAVQELADDIDNSVLNNPNALLCLSQIREKDKYLLEHSINVGILMSIFSTSMGYDKATVKELTTGAFLHDVGKILVPSEVLNKPGKLTAKEWIEMKRHVVYGQQVLNKSEGISDIAKSICGLHHERLDGTGYPVGYKADEINVYGRMAAVVDVYDAITAARCYHDGKSPFEAMRFLLKLGGEGHLDVKLVYNFIRCMSVYPVGTLVELDNGKLGVVQQANNEKPDRPLLKIFFNLRSRSYEKISELNLASTSVHAKIVCTHHPDEFGICLPDFM